MSSPSWYRSWPALLATSLLLPPVGLLLLWMRPGIRVPRKLLGSLLLVILAVLYLHKLFGLHMEMNGSGIRPILSFGKPESHYAALEEHRQQQHQSLPPTITAPAIQRQAARIAKESRSSEIAGMKTAAFTASTKSLAPYWTDFRGPGRDGRYTELRINTHWPSQGPPLLWRQPIGGGYASFVVADGHAFTIEQRRNQEVVVAYEVETGRELWTHAWEAEFHESMGGDGPRATPTWHEGRLYALGAQGELRCLNAENGKQVWAVNILRDNQATNLTWGMAASPLIVDDKLIVLPGGPGGKSVAAYDKITGKPIWKVLDDQEAYTSPMLVTLAGKRQILVVSARRAMGLTTEDGTVLWDYPWVTEYGINSAQPLILGENRFFISAGYGHGSAVVEISANGEKFSARTVWQNTRMKNKFTSSVLQDGYIYGLDEAILACIQADSGDLRWKGGRYGYGQVLLANGHLIVLSESGELALVKAAPDNYQELVRFQAIEGKTWNDPAIAEGRLLVRNANQMACFDLLDLRGTE
jgi:outer membrane protein assembly factor BamB